MRRKGNYRKRNVADRSKSYAVSLPPTLLDLPPLVLVKICDYVDDRSLATLLITSRCLSNHIDWRSVWNCRAKRQPFVWTNEHDAKTISAKDRYLAGKRLKTRQDFNRKTAVHFNKRLLPWLYLDTDSLWYSRENSIQSYAFGAGNRHQKQHSTKTPSFRLNTKDDIGRFALDDRFVVAGTGGGSVALWDRQQQSNALPCCVYSGAHSSDVRMCDLRHNVAVSGSRDATVRLWRIADQSLEPIASVMSPDRVWSVRLSADSRFVAVGTTGIGGSDINRTPLFIWDINSERRHCVFGSDCRKGAGVTDISFESPYTVLATSYDGTVRLYDMRTNKSEWKWEEPFDSALFCLTSDLNFNIFVGSSRHCAVWAIDRRWPRTFKGIYLDATKSPIYSVVRNSRYVFGASDTAVHQITLI